MKLIDLDDEILTEILLWSLPSSLDSLLMVNRQINKLLQARQSFWSHCLSFSFETLYMKPLHVGTSPKTRFRNLSIATKEARAGVRWRFQGYERESEDPSDATKLSSEYKWRMELDNPEENKENITASIFWCCVKSQWGPDPNLGKWEVERVRGTFDREKGTFKCMGYECGAGLQTGRYVFQLEEGGLKLTGWAIPTDDDESLKCHIIGLAESPECIDDPASYIRHEYFPEITPGWSLENGWEGYDS